MPDQVQDDTAQMVAFLRARLDEDETEIGKHPDGEDDHLAVVGFAAEVATGYPCESYLRISKQRALLEVEAKRRIVGLHDGVHECPGASGHMGTYDPSLQVDNYGGPCPTLIAFAAVYADHPDYREDWRP